MRSHALMVDRVAHPVNIPGHRRAVSSVSSRRRIQGSQLAHDHRLEVVGERIAGRLTQLVKDLERIFSSRPPQSSSSSSSSSSS
jgi:hypothetical protein